MTEDYVNGLDFSINSNSPLGDEFEKSNMAQNTGAESIGMDTDMANSIRNGSGLLAELSESKIMPVGYMTQVKAEPITDQSNYCGSNSSENSIEYSDPFSLFSNCGNCKSSMLDENNFSRTPKLLPCLHIYCCSCIKASQSDASPISYVRCPAEQCGVSFRMSETGNLHCMQALAAKQASREIKMARSKICKSCDENQDVTSFCINCSENLCSACVTAHKRVRVTKDHIIQRISDSQLLAVQDDALITCKIHPQEELQLYCETCEVLTCRDCQLLQHRDHKYQFLKEASELYKLGLGNLLSQLSERSEAFQKWQNVIEERVEEIDVKQAEIIDSIKCMGAELIDTINSRCKELAQQTHIVCKENKEQLQFRNSEIKQLRCQIIRALRMGKMIMEHSSPGLVLEGKRLFLNHLNSALIAPCVVPNPMHKFSLKFVNQNPNLVNVIGKMAYISAEGVPYPNSFSSSWSGPGVSKSMVPSAAYPTEQSSHLSISANIPHPYSGLSHPMTSLRHSATKSHPVAGPQHGACSQARMQHIMSLQQSHHNGFIHERGASMTQKSPPDQSATISSSQQKLNGCHPSSMSTYNAMGNSAPHGVGMPDAHARHAELLAHHLDMNNYSKKLQELNGATLVMDTPQAVQGSHGVLDNLMSNAPGFVGPQHSADRKVGHKTLNDGQADWNYYNKMPSSSLGHQSANFPQMQHGESSFGPRSIVKVDREKEAAKVSAVAKLLENGGVKREKQEDSYCFGNAGMIPTKESSSMQGNVSYDYSPKLKSAGKDERMENPQDPNGLCCACCHRGGDLLCCDTCPKVFHLACHIPALTFMPAGSWSCGFCLTSPDDILHSADATSSITAREKKTLYRILLELYVHKSIQHFHEPVDEKEVPYYYQVVKNPIFFSTIRAKLVQDGYANIFAFLQDVKLLIFNCRKTLYMMQPDVAHDCKVLEEFFEEVVAKFLPSMYKHMEKFVPYSTHSRMKVGKRTLDDL